MYYTVFVTTNMFDGRKYIGHHKTDYINDTWLGSGLLLKMPLENKAEKTLKRKFFLYLIMKMTWLIKPQRLLLSTNQNTT